MRPTTNSSSFLSYASSIGGVRGALLVSSVVMPSLLLVSLATGQPETLPEAEHSLRDHSSRGGPAASDSSAIPELPTPAEVENSQRLLPESNPSPVATSQSDLPLAREDEGEEQQQADLPVEKESSPPVEDTRLALGGFGGIAVKYSRVLGHDGIFTGGEGAFLLQHAVSIGLGGAGLTNEINPTHLTQLSFKYGGLILRYHFFSSEVVNFAVGSLIGAGFIGVCDRHTNRDDVDWEKVGETVFVFEPELGLYMNVRPWMRLGITSGYRLVTGVEKNDLSDTDVRGATGGFSIQLGAF